MAHQHSLKALDSLDKEDLYRLIKVHPNYNGDIGWTKYTKQQYLEKIKQLQNEYINQEASGAVKRGDQMKGYQKKKIIQKHIGKIMSKKISNARDQIYREIRGTIDKDKQNEEKCACNKTLWQRNLIKHGENECISYYVTGVGRINNSRVMITRRVCTVDSWCAESKNYIISDGSPKRCQAYVFTSPDEFRLPHTIEIPTAVKKRRERIANMCIRAITGALSYDIAQIIAEYL
jgi:hypothetical protein